MTPKSQAALEVAAKQMLETIKVIRDQGPSEFIPEKIDPQIVKWEAALAATLSPPGEDGAMEALDRLTKNDGAIYAIQGFSYSRKDDIETLRQRLSSQQAVDDGSPPLGAKYRIEHDGFQGTVIGHYERKDGYKGAVLQQDGTKIVHVYGLKWLVPAPPQGHIARKGGGDGTQ